MKIKPFYLLIAFIVGMIVSYFVFSGRSEEMKIVIPSQENTKTIFNPIPERIYDTIYYDSIERVKVLKVVRVENPVNKELLLKYEQAVKDNDSLRMIALFKEAVTERIYKEFLEDSVQVIQVESSVIGILKSQVISYKTKERIIKLQSEKLKPSVFLGGFAYGLAEDPVFGIGANLLNRKKNKLLSIGYDTKKRVHLGFTVKLF